MATRKREHARSTRKCIYVSDPPRPGSRHTPYLMKKKERRLLLYIQSIKKEKKHAHAFDYQKGGKKDVAGIVSAYRLIYVFIPTACARASIQLCFSLNGYEEESKREREQERGEEADFTRALPDNGTQFLASLLSSGFTPLRARCKRLSRGEDLHMYSAIK